MPNRNYEAGRRFEYETINDYEERGFRCIRASGSHGAYDIVAYKSYQKPVFIQCKVVNVKRNVDTMINVFVESTPPELYFHQSLRVKVKGTKQPVEVIV